MTWGLLPLISLAILIGACSSQPQEGSLGKEDESKLRPVLFCVTIENTLDQSVTTTDAGLQGTDSDIDYWAWSDASRNRTGPPGGGSLAPGSSEQICGLFDNQLNVLAAALNGNGAAYIKFASDDGKEYKATIQAHVDNEIGDDYSYVTVTMRDGDNKSIDSVESPHHISDYDPNWKNGMDNKFDPANNLTFG